MRSGLKVQLELLNTLDVKLRDVRRREYTKAEIEELERQIVTIVSSIDFVTLAEDLDKVA